MSQSRFSYKSFGQISINNQYITTNTTGSLKVNGVEVDEGGSGNSNFTFLNNAVDGVYPLAIVQNTFGNSATLANSLLSYSQNISNSGGGFFTPSNNTFSMDKDAISFYTSKNNFYLSDVGDNIVLTSNLSSIIINDQNKNANIDIASNNTQGSLGIYVGRYQANANSSIILSANTITYPRGMVTVDQTGSITNTVDTGRKFFGRIGLVSSTLAAQSSVDIPITNTYVTNDSIILLTIHSYNGTGIPTVYVKSATNATGFTIRLSNASTTDPLSSYVYINYSIMKAQ